MTTTTTGLDEIFALPLPLGVRPQKLRIHPSQPALAFVWAADGGLATTVYRWDAGHLRAEGVGLVDSTWDDRGRLLAWSDRSLIADGVELLHTDATIRGVLTSGDRIIVTTGPESLLLDPDGGVISCVPAPPGAENIANVAWSDGDLMTFRGTEPYRLLEASGAFTTVRWSPDPNSGLDVADFLADLAEPGISTSPRSGSYSISVTRPDGTFELDLPQGARLYNVDWSVGDVVLDWVDADRVTRTIERWDPQGERSTIFHETSPAWHGALAKVCRSQPQGDRLLIVEEQSGLARATILLTDGSSEHHETRFEVKDAQWFGSSGEVAVIAGASTPHQLRPLLLPPTTDLAAAPGLCTDLACNIGGDAAWVRSTPLDGWTVEIRTEVGRIQEVVRTIANQELLEPTPELIPAVADRPASTVYRPAHPNGRGVVFVHGNGYLQDAVDGQHPWYWREHLFNRLLARRGFTVCCPDYAGSEGYGAAWATKVRHTLGTEELVDLEAANRWLVDNGCDPDQIYLYGGSHGGYLVLRALLLQPNLWAGGAALRAVTDWAGYARSDPLFTLQRLDEFELNPAAYGSSTVVGLMDRLTKPLLLLHGVVDDNVPIAQILNLLDEAHRCGTSDKIDMMLYPAEAHSFKQPHNWLDEYRRVLALFTRVHDSGVEVE